MGGNGKVFYREGEQASDYETHNNNNTRRERDDASLSARRVREAGTRQHTQGGARREHPTSERRSNTSTNNVRDTREVLHDDRDRAPRRSPERETARTTDTREMVRRDDGRDRPTYRGPSPERETTYRDTRQVHYDERDRERQRDRERNNRPSPERERSRERDDKHRRSPKKEKKEKKVKKEKKEKKEKKAKKEKPAEETPPPPPPVEEERIISMAELDAMYAEDRKAPEAFYQYPTLAELTIEDEEEEMSGTASNPSSREATPEPEAAPAVPAAPSYTPSDAEVDEALAQMQKIAPNKDFMVKYCFGSTGDFDAIIKGVFVTTKAHGVSQVVGTAKVPTRLEEYVVEGRGVVSVVLKVTTRTNVTKTIRFTDIMGGVSREGVAQYLAAAHRSKVWVPKEEDVAKKLNAMRAYLLEKKKMDEAKKKVVIEYAKQSSEGRLLPEEYVVLIAAAAAASRAAEMWKNATPMQMSEAMDEVKQGSDEYSKMRERLLAVLDEKAKKRGELAQHTDTSGVRERRLRALARSREQLAAATEKAVAEAEKTEALYTGRLKRKRENTPAIRKQQEDELASLQRTEERLKARRTEMEATLDTSEQQVIDLQDVYTAMDTQVQEREKQLNTLHGTVQDLATLHARLVKRFTSLSVDIEPMETEVASLSQALED